MKQPNYELMDQIKSWLNSHDEHERTAHSITFGLLPDGNQAPFEAYNRQLGIVNYYLKRMLKDKEIDRTKKGNAWIYEVKK
jgi:hypothetical protein